MYPSCVSSCPATTPAADLNSAWGAIYLVWCANQTGARWQLTSSEDPTAWHKPPPALDGPRRKLCRRSTMPSRLFRVTSNKAPSAGSTTPASNVPDKSFEQFTAKSTDLWRNSTTTEAFRHRQFTSGVALTNPRPWHAAGSVRGAELGAGHCEPKAPGSHSRDQRQSEPCINKWRTRWLQSRLLTSQRRKT